MSPMVSIPFQHQDQSYNMLLSHRLNGDKLQLRVTVMNGDLEKALHGHSVFEYSNGSLLAEATDVSDEVIALRSSLLKAIDTYCVENPIQASSLS